jgi:hypothetical protein
MIIPGLTSCAFTRLIAPGKTFIASFCMPTEGAANGSESASPRNTCAAQYCLYSLSDIPSSLSKTRRSRQPGSRTMSLMRSPRSHVRFSPAKILLIFAAGLFGFTTAATSSPWAAARGIRAKLARAVSSRTGMDLIFMFSSDVRT